MTDEAAFLLRVSVFGLLAGAVYWFLSYEPLGTVALLLLGVGPGFAGLFIVLHRRGGGGGGGRDPLPDVLRRFAGIPRADPPGPRTLEDDDLAVLPLGSIWPFAASFGLSIALSGLVFGLWLVILGLGVALYAGWGWVAAVVRENRYGHIEPADRPREAGAGAGGEQAPADREPTR